jgi:hypothetical protein
MEQSDSTRMGDFEKPASTKLPLFLFTNEMGECYVVLLVGARFGESEFTRLRQ